MDSQIDKRALPSEAAPVSTVKRMKLRYAGPCSRCGTTLEAGMAADYDRASKTVACIACAPRRAIPDQAEWAASPRHAITPDVPLELEVVDGTAGGSAVREFDRRHDARRDRVQGAHPKIGGMTKTGTLIPALDIGEHRSLGGVSGRGVHH